MATSSFFEQFWPAFTFSGALLSVVLAAGQMLTKKKNVKNYVLALALFAAFVLLLMSWLELSNLGTHWPGIALYVPAMCVFGPSLFIFFQAVFEDQFVFRKWYSLLFLPAIGTLLFVVAVYLQTGQTLGDLYDTLNEKSIGVDKILMIGGTCLNLSLYVYFTFRTVTVFGWRKLLGDAHSRLLLISFVNTVVITTAVLVALIRSDIAFIHQCAIAIAAAVFAGTALHFRYPDFFSELEDLVQSEKYQRTLLTGTDIKVIASRLEKLMEEDKLYTYEDLTLADLAEAVELNAHQMSEYLNNHAGKSFPTFINEHRIQTAQKMLLEQPEASILSIAFHVGFQSKSTFNVVFRRVTGMSPSQYRRTAK